TWLSLFYSFRFSLRKQGESKQLAEETGEISEDLRDTDRDGMQKAKHALKRPPLKHILNRPLWTRFRFLHGGGQSIPQLVALEAERFLLFPPHPTARTNGFTHPLLDDPEKRE
ncbi:hypothetical protein, partial [Brevibacillus porteri]|uniref:hypothetical protein n=1 Tax=Brevibacillus porteri TaxID=2126350 RepID=UPI003D2345D5